MEATQADINKDLHDLIKIVKEMVDNQNQQIQLLTDRIKRLEQFLVI